MSATKAKRVLKCGCERETCSSCGAVVGRCVWKHRCHRHEVGISLGATTIWSICDRCAHETRVGPLTTIPAGTRITLSDGREIVTTKPMTMGPVHQHVETKEGVK